MKKAFEDVARLDSLENVGLARKGCKLSEESGELMQVICRYVGMKKNEMTPEEMREEALGEVADVIQNCFCIANQFGFDSSGFIMEEVFFQRNLDADLLSQLGCSFSRSVGRVMEDVCFQLLNSSSVKERKVEFVRHIKSVIKDTYSIAQELGIKYEEIEPKILEKNKKWMLRINNKNE
jgi:NTP pyrophosphatase (non-canonical NTP hydrolase)